MTLAKVSHSPPSAYNRTASICGHEASEFPEPKTISLDCYRRNSCNPCSNRRVGAIETLGARGRTIACLESWRRSMGSCARAKWRQPPRPNHWHRTAAVSNPAARCSGADRCLLRGCCENPVRRSVRTISRCQWRIRDRPDSAHCGRYGGLYWHPRLREGDLSQMKNPN